MLRRRKTDVINGKPLIELPERHLSIVPCDFDEDERQFYFTLENKIDEAMKKFVKNDEVMKNYTNVMVLLLRLRQGESTIESTTLPFCILMVCGACNHPSLVSKDYNTDREAIESHPAPKDDQEDEDLTSMFQQLVVSKGKKCQLCQDEYILYFSFLAFGIYQRSYCSKINYGEHRQRWRPLQRLSRACPESTSQVPGAEQGFEFTTRLRQDSQIARVAQGDQRARRRRGRTRGREDDSFFPVYIDARSHPAIPQRRRNRICAM